MYAQVATTRACVLALSLSVRTHPNPANRCKNKFFKGILVLFKYLEVILSIKNTFQQRIKIILFSDRIVFYFLWELEQRVSMAAKTSSLIKWSHFDLKSWVTGLSKIWPWNMSQIDSQYQSIGLKYSPITRNPGSNFRFTSDSIC